MTSLLTGYKGELGSGVLPAISALRKICNHPDLAAQPGGPEDGEDDATAAAAGGGAIEVPAAPATGVVEHSGELNQAFY